jgi:hypothetical protein
MQVLSNELSPRRTLLGTGPSVEAKRFPQTDFPLAKEEHSEERFMKKVVLLAILALALPTMAFATTYNIVDGGSVALGVATFSGSATVGGSISITAPLTTVNGSAATGSLGFTTGTLTATGSSNVFDFTGGSITLTVGGSTLFTGTFSSGTVTVNGTNAYTIAGTLSNGAGFITTIDTHGDVSGRGTVVVTPEPGTLGLLGTGLIGIAGIVRRKLRG